MAYSEAQKRATLKYRQKNKYSPAVSFPKDMEMTIKKAGRDSVNAFITQAVYEKLEKMGYEVPEEYKK